MISAPSFAAAQDIGLVADVVQFRSLDGKTRWEFQYAFADTALTYAITPQGYLGELYCRLRVVGPLQDTTTDEWISAATARERVPQHKQFHSGVRRLFLTPGSYSATLDVRDLNDTNRTMHSEFTSTVRQFGLQPSLSDVMFTSRRADNVDSAFMRNGVDAIPNPRHEMIGTDPAICLYAEVYNARSNHLDTFVAEYTVLDNVMREMVTSYRELVAVDDGLVLREDLPAFSLRTGVYRLRVSIKSQDLTETYASSEDRFYILNPELPPAGELMLTEEQQFLSSEWAVKTGEDLEHELILSDVLATKAEKITREGLESERSKQRYLYKFWQERDPDPRTQMNERLDDFRKMYTRANQLYSSAMVREGWKTDRGLILLKYGRPTQEEIYVQTIDTKPYEIWFYQNMQGGVHFYFVDWQLMQNHKLVHSTKIGEIRDEKWFDRYARAFTPDLHKEQDYLPTAR